jgi:hypothetical protein
VEILLGGSVVSSLEDSDSVSLPSSPVIELVSWKKTTPRRAPMKGPAMKNQRLLLVIIVLRTRSGVLGGFTHGLTYLVAILAGVTIYNGHALLNPALAIGLIIGSSSFSSSLTDESNLWFFIAGPFIGALLGVVFFQLTSSMTGDDGNDTESESSSDDTTEPPKRISTTVTQMVGRPVPQPRPNPGYGNQQPYRGNQY